MNDFYTEHAAVFSMVMERGTNGLPKGEYLKKASALSESASKDLALRIGRHFSDELTKAGLQDVEALALALEREDEQLNEWRLALAKIRAESRRKSHQTNLV